MFIQLFLASMRTFSFVIKSTYYILPINMKPNITIKGNARIVSIILVIAPNFFLEISTYQQKDDLNQPGQNRNTSRET